MLTCLELAAKTRYTTRFAANAEVFTTIYWLKMPVQNEPCDEESLGLATVESHRLGYLLDESIRCFTPHDRLCDDIGNVGI